MGGNEIILARLDSLPPGGKLDMGLSLLSKPGIGGDQMGLLTEGECHNCIRAEIIDKHSGNYIPICGGLTQVLGMSHRKRFVTDLLELNIPADISELTLVTDGGKFPVQLSGGERGHLTYSDMSSFARSVYAAGVKEVEVLNARAYRAGSFLVGFVDDLLQVSDRIPLNPIDEHTEDLIVRFQHVFSKKFAPHPPNRDFVIVDYDKRCSSPGLLFPHNLAEGLVEPSCGTGTIAAVIAMAKRGLIEDGQIELRFRSGGTGNSIGGPDRTIIKGYVREGTLTSPMLSHDNVQIVASGQLYSGEQNT